jgi:hypothetical protein
VRRITDSLLAPFRGALLIYGCWAVCVWFVFVYGTDLMSLLGLQTEVTFVKSWAVAVAVDSAFQLRVVVQAVIVGMLTQYAFEVVRVSPQHMWFERWLDSLSVQSTCAAGVEAGDKFGGLSALEYARAHSRHFRNVVLG